jgi:hypothetical protein
MSRLRDYLESELNIKYCQDPGIIERLWRLLWNRTAGKYVPLSPPELRPQTWGKLVFLPEGNVSNDTLIHEAQHTVQIRKHKGSKANWYMLYFTDPMFRASEEVMAQVAVAEWLYWVTGGNTIPELQLDGYFYTNAAKEHAVMLYEQCMHDLRRMGQGYALTKAGGAAIRGSR